MDREKCKLILDSPQSIYYAGQEIKGKMCLILVKKTKIRGIKFQITGKGKCSWFEVLLRETEAIDASERKHQRSVVYSGKEMYVNQESYIFGSKSSRPVDLDPGMHIYNFSITLDTRLPSSFEGNFGRIRYKIRFLIEKPWNFDEKHVFPLTVVKPHNPPTRNPTPILRQMTRNIGIFGMGPISLVAELPCNYAFRGKKMTLLVTVDNKSSTHIEKLKFAICQINMYYCQQPLRAKRLHVVKLFKKETGGVQKKTERCFAHELQVPSCPPTDNESSQLIHTRYEVQVDVVLPTIYKNITVTLPFDVCTDQMIGGNPFETGSGISSVGWSFPSSDNSLNNSQQEQQPQQSFTSPTHSFYSDNSSLYSSVSDTSTTTLSPPSVPAPFIRTGSTAASVRSSIRSSNFEFTQMNGSYPPIPTSRSISRASSSRHRVSSVQQNCEELPPSYAELFGNSSQSQPAETPPSAPPLTPPDK